MGRFTVERRRNFPERVPRPRNLKSKVHRGLFRVGLASKASSPKPPKVSGDTETLQRKIGRLLFRDDVRRGDKPEVLTIVFPKKKAKYFEFLKAYTKWGSVGKWNEVNERNVVITVHFYDKPDDSVGRKLKDLLEEYGEVHLKEDEFYFYTSPVSETSLRPNPPVLGDSSILPAAGRDV